MPSLRSLGVRFLILAGCVTDQCVESAVRDACDKHYYVTLVTGEAPSWPGLTDGQPMPPSKDLHLLGSSHLWTNACCVPP